MIDEPFLEPDAPRAKKPRRWPLLLIVIAAFAGLGAAVLFAIRATTPDAPAPPPGYKLVERERLVQSHPQMQWLGEEAGGYGVLLVGVAKDRASDLPQATVFYGERGELTSLAVFLTASGEEAVAACQSGACPSGFKLLRLPKGVAAVRSFTPDNWEAYATVGASKFYIISDLPGLTAEEALAQLRPIGED